MGGSVEQRPRDDRDLDRLRSGRHPRSAQFLADSFSAKEFLADSRVKYTPKGRIRWSRTLVREQLVQRQRGCCHICGGLMDEADYTIEVANRVAGPNYPTFEHIVPLSRGGR